MITIMSMQTFKKKNIKINGGGVILYSIHNNKIYLLLGRESNFSKWKFGNHYSEFGGQCNKNEKPMHCILREFYEETQGMFGNIKINKNIIIEETIQIEKSKQQNKTNILYLLCKIPYDNKICDYYNNIFNYYVKMVGKKNIIQYLNKGYFEKNKIKYFQLNTLMNYKKIMRPHFIRIYNKLLEYFVDGYAVI